MPWYTYGCRSFLERRIRQDTRVFEYGAGLSSLWYSRRVSEVFSAEHNPKWADVVSSRAPANCHVLLRQDEASYVGSIHEFGPFDLVVIDGIHRRQAAAAAIQALRPNGVIIWDNSDWQEFHDTFPSLQADGFRRIEFVGMGPINRQGWETSVLYRDDNWLGI